MQEQRWSGCTVGQGTTRTAKNQQRQPKTTNPKTRRFALEK
jgi:hypothetical protein